MARKTLTDRLLRTLKTDAADTVVPGLAVRIGAAAARRPSSWSDATPDGRIRLGARSVPIRRSRSSRRATPRATGSPWSSAASILRSRSRSSGKPTAFASPTPSRLSPKSFLEKHVATRRTATAIGRLVRGKLIARWRDRPIDTIGKRDVIDMIEDVQEKSGPAMARQSLAYARRLFGWAAARDLVTVNPCAAVAPPIFCRRRSRATGC